MQGIHLDPPPLVVHDDGVIRVAGTRVTVEAIVIAFDAGATPEEIVQKYPTIGLSAVYSVCAYVLAHRAEVDKYVLAQDQAAQQVRAEMEVHFPPTGIRDRLLARRRAQP